MITAEVTISGELFNLPAMEKRIIAAVDEVIDEALKDFNATKATFKSPNTTFDFEVQRAKRQGDTISGFIRTDNYIYYILNNGTGARPRTAKTAKGMSFRSKYRAKTRPGHISSGSSSRSGRWVSGIRQVTSGPIQAREWDKTIAKSRQPDLVKKVNAAISTK